MASKTPGEEIAVEAAPVDEFFEPPRITLRFSTLVICPSERVRNEKERKHPRRKLVGLDVGRIPEELEKDIERRLGRGRDKRNDEMTNITLDLKA